MLGDRAEPRDRRHAALVVVLERLTGRLDRRAARLIALAAYRPPWMATCATPGSLSSDIMSPTTKTSGCPGSVRSGLTRTRPARSMPAPDWSASILPSGLAWTPAAQTLQTESIRRWVPSESSTSMPVASTLTTLEPSWTSTPMSASLSAALPPRLVTEGAEHGRGGVEQDDAGVAGSIRRKSWRSVRWDSSAICPAISTPVGPGADDDEGHQPLALGRVVGHLGQLEAAEDAAAQLQRVVDALHARGELGEVVVAEVGLARTGGDDEAVVGEVVVAVQQLGGHGARLEVDAGHLARAPPSRCPAG